MEIVDVQGKKLNVGDKVYFTYYKWADLQYGEIIRITQNTVHVKTDWGLPTFIRKNNVRSRIIKI